MGNIKKLIADEFSGSIKAHQFAQGDKELMQAANFSVETCINTLKKGGKIMFAGNGGSAADAQHLAAELVSRLNFDRPGLSAIALTTDTSALTAIGNDYGYEHVFARQLEAVARPDDVLFAISTSGNSPNILRLLEAATKRRVHSIGLTGNRAGEMDGLCDTLLAVPSPETPRIQEIHILLGHAICGAIEQEMFGG